jgi:hypothetical protein
MEEIMENRDDARSKIKDILEGRTKKRVVFIYGKQGYGKSKVLEHVFDEEIKDEVRKKILMINIESTSSNEDGDLLFRITRELDKKSIRFKYKWFLINHRNAFELLLRSFTPISNFLFQYRDTALDNVRLHSFEKYIEYCLKISKKTVVLNIDQMQDYDTYSLKALCRICEHSNNSIFVFEYTFKSSRYESKLMKLRKEIQRSIEADKIEDIEILKLGFTHCVNLLNPNIPRNETTVKAVEFLYEGEQGGIVRNYLDVSAYELLMKINQGDVINYRDLIDTKVKMIRKDTFKMLLTTVFCVSADLKLTRVILMIISFYNEDICLAERDIDTQINQLIDMGVLICKGEDIFTESHMHKNVIESYDFFKSRRVVFRMIEKFQDKHSTDGVIRFQLKLLYLSLRNELNDYDASSDLTEVISYANENISFQNSSFIRLIENYREKFITSNKIRKDIDYLIFTYYYGNGSYLSCKDILNKYRDDVHIDNRNYILLYLVIIETHVGIIKVANELLSNISFDVDDKEMSCLIDTVKQVVNLTFLTKENGKNFSEKIVEKYKNVSNDNYGYILRNHADYVNREKKLEYVEKSIKYFEVNGNVEGKNQTLISLSLELALQTRYKEAREILENLIETRGGKRLRYYYVENNLSVIDIMTNKVDDKTINRLFSAYSIVEDEYEEIIILTNIIAYFCTTQNYPEAKKYVQRLVSSNFRDYESKDFLYIVYNSLVMYYYLTENSAAYESFKKQAYVNLIIDCDSMDDFERTVYEKFEKCTLIKCKMNDENYVEKSFLFDPGFLAYWGFSINIREGHLLS